MKKIILLFSIFLLAGTFCKAEVTLNHIFDNNMVIQREKPVRIWGWAAAGEKVEVSFEDQNMECVADNEGKWSVTLQPMAANCEPQTLKVTGESNQVIYTNILIGDVWILGGQSNMEFDLSKINNGDLEVLAANNSNIRIITIPNVSSGGTPMDNFKRINQYSSWSKNYENKGSWSVCYPERIRQFSAMGYIFGKTIQQITGVPVGLVDAAWGGTTIESWVSAEKLATVPGNAELMAYWNDRLASYDPDKNLKEKIGRWKQRNEDRKKKGQDPLPKPTTPDASPAADRNFPGGAYNGYINPIKGLAVKGILFNHGYNNAGPDSRPRIYAANFDALIADWRETFNDENLPFGIIELSAGGAPQTNDNFEAAMLDAAPFIKEGQHKAYLKNKNVGYCAAHDFQVNWYHPQKKSEVAVRATRWALAEVYGYQELIWRPAKLEEVVKTDTAIIVDFDIDVKSTDDRPIEGFAIAGSDRHFYPAQAEYVVTGKDHRGRTQYDKSRIIVSSPLVKKPVAVRYAWARCPIGNLYSNRIIPLPLFRTDDWDIPQAPFPPYDSEEFKQHVENLKALTKEANELTKARKIEEAEYFLKTAK